MEYLILTVIFYLAIFVFFSPTKKRTFKYLSEFPPGSLNHRERQFCDKYLEEKNRSRNRKHIAKILRELGC